MQTGLNGTNPDSTILGATGESARCDRSKKLVQKLKSENRRLRG